MKEKIEKFLDSKEREIQELASVYPNKKSLVLDYQQLEEFDSELAKKLMQTPDEIIPLFNALLSEKDMLLSTEGVEKMGGVEAAERPMLHVRFKNIPKEKGYTVTIRDINSDYIGHLISTEGVINKISDVLPKVYKAVFYCNRCNERASIIQERRMLTKPSKCTHCGRDDFRFIEDQSSWVDIQYLEIQEPLEQLKGTENARKIEVIVEDDFTDVVTAGDKVVVNGILRLKPQKTNIQTPVYHKFIEANYAEALQKDFEELETTKEEEKEIKKLSKDPAIYEKIIGSIAPSIYGYNEVKEAIALQLFGGRPGKKTTDGTSIRSDMHILLIGDPGVAKSRMLQYVKNIAPKSIYVTGKGTTGAGLTATAEKDEFADGAWTLKAGALVLASGGIAAIDEFDKMTKEDRSAMHEAMEQQSYHPSFELFLADGGKVKIGEYVDKLFEANPRGVVDGIECEILPLCDYVPLYTTDFNKVFKVGADRVSRHKAPDYFVEITYSNGRIILVTPEHPLYLWDDGFRCIEASKARVGMFVPSPKVIPNSSKAVCLTADKPAYGRKNLTFPVKLNPDLSAVLGFLVSEGHAYASRSAEIGFSNKTQFMLGEFMVLMERLFDLKPSVNVSSCTKTTTLRYISTKLYGWFKENFPEIFALSHYKRIPSKILSGSVEDAREFLRAAFLGDGSVESNSVCYRTSSRGLAEDYQDLLLKLAVRSRIAVDKESMSYKVYIKGDSLRKFFNELVDPRDFRYKRIAFIVGKSCRKNRHHDVLPADLSGRIINLHKQLGLAYNGYFNQHLENNFGVSREVFSEKMFMLKKRLECVVSGAARAANLRQLRSATGWSQNKVALEAGFTRGMVDYVERKGYSKNKRDEIFHKAKEMTLLSIDKSSAELTELERLLESNVAFERIKKTRMVRNKGPLRTRWVYDVTVEPTHSFISSGVVLHNTISIAKAGMMTTFRANTSILAASNPKFSRFDPYKTPAEQFDIPPTLISRFDLIFPVKDIVDMEQDKKIADHIMKMHGTEKDMEEIKADIPADLFRKYISYSRKNVKPVLTTDAMDKIKEYYVTLRSSSHGGAVPATPRQLEALIRLAEASAKIRLSDKVTVADAERAINLTNFVLREVAYDKSSGLLDIDRIATDHPKAARDKIKMVEDAIRELVGNVEGNTAALNDILDHVAGHGISRSDAEKYLNELKLKGIIYEPKHGQFTFAIE
ncbi:MAG: hypothetical protein FJY77_00190 [Candidatus Altiarchaeales archaeon]|nr:hypothetical protein [Candidatus Altiarchaeales archaeon]